MLRHMIAHDLGSSVLSVTVIALLSLLHACNSSNALCTYTLLLIRSKFGIWAVTGV